MLNVCVREVSSMGLDGSLSCWGMYWCGLRFMAFEKLSEVVARKLKAVCNNRIDVLPALTMMLLFSPCESVCVSSWRNGGPGFPWAALASRLVIPSQRAPFVLAPPPFAMFTEIQEVQC
uniref:Uncharacterized protein n=1 Tax=Cyclopterus lumpus TaxID=8103 RepID=A0A8C3AXK6_CYCLU